MIFILSNNNDTSTKYVIEWLNFLKKDWLCINAQDNVEIEFCGDEIILKTVSFSIKLSEIKGFWYRRGYLSVNNDFITQINQFDSLQSEELNYLIQFIYYKLTKIKNINSIANSDVNKLIVNDIAKELGILTPRDLLFSNANDLKSELKKDSTSYITKVISGRCMQNFEDFTIFNYTNLVEIDKIKTETFFPSLIQNYIDKKYELRIFYLDGDFYTMAIFSQNDNKTNIDFRNYNYDRPNRTVPFKLPKEIESSLNLLMKKLDLNCGSIDMVVTPKNEYVFLEVNPIGQFGMISYPCNYNLEKKIAEYL
ncbi:MAG: grasp-with-spasm system ATP-grasp peptide maturase [Flavobacterium sp.]|uniref:grasp-with-spasm system ATP-grasp peptide maturase n=1 Tax=Flavobacterium sp. TaxID=239 RepID=UPI003267516A